MFVFQLLNYRFKLFPIYFDMYKWLVSQALTFRVWFKEKYMNHLCLGKWVKIKLINFILFSYQKTERWIGFWSFLNFSRIHDTSLCLSPLVEEHRPFTRVLHRNLSWTNFTSCYSFLDIYFQFPTQSVPWSSFFPLIVVYSKLGQSLNEFFSSQINMFSKLSRWHWALKYTNHSSI